MLTKKSIKQFLKPDLRKVLFVLVFIGFSYLFKGSCLSSGRLGVCEEYGFPMHYLGMNSGDFVYLPQYSILWAGLAIDLIFWYLVSCLLISVWDKIRKKPVV